MRFWFGAKAQWYDRVTSRFSPLISVKGEPCSRFAYGSCWRAALQARSQCQNCCRWILLKECHHCHRELLDTCDCIADPKSSYNTGGRAREQGRVIKKNRGVVITCHVKPQYIDANCWPFFSCNTGGRAREHRPVLSFHLSAICSWRACAG